MRAITDIKLVGFGGLRVTVSKLNLPGHPYRMWVLVPDGPTTIEVRDEHGEEIARHTGPEGSGRMASLALAMTALLEGKYEE